MIGERIKFLREELGLSQEELAGSVGMHPNTVARWERGELVPRGTSIAKIARSLNTTSSYLLDGDETLFNMEQEGMNEKEKSLTPRMRKEHSFEENRGMVVYETNGRRLEIPATREFYELFKQIIEDMKEENPQKGSVTLLKPKGDNSFIEKTLEPA